LMKLSLLWQNIIKILPIFDYSASQAHWAAVGFINRWPEINHERWCELVNASAIRKNMHSP
jgi:hypothetical protein